MLTESIKWTNSTRKLSDLIPWEVNPRQLTENQAKHLKASIHKFGQAYPLLISPKNDVYDGHQRRALMDIMQEYGHDSDIDVRVSSRLLTYDERRELVVRLHENTGDWNWDEVPNLYEVAELQGWGFKAFDYALEEIEEGSKDKDPLLDIGNVPDTVWPSNNRYGIPLLDIALQADAFDNPIETWGIKSRTNKMGGTYHFYTDDYRFRNIWDNPQKLVDSGCVNAVEPNFSINFSDPLAVSIWRTYQKRWLSRYWQSQGVRIFVDLNVSAGHDDINLYGVPAGWAAYATRGYADQLGAIDAELELAKGHAYPNSVLFLVYGGGYAVRDWCMDNGALWEPEYMDKVKGKF